MVGTSSLGTTVKILLADGTPDGLRIVEKSNWTSLATMCSRVQYRDVRSCPEFGRPCVYLLIGWADEDANRLAIYVGQADIGRDRLDQHARTKDFWTQLILFTSKDSNLNRVHVQYLESKLIQRGFAAKRADLKNGNVPNPPTLSAADIADAESFLNEMLTIYPLLGVTAFEEIEQIPVTSPEGMLTIKRGGVDATGRDTPQGFYVMRGSTGRVELVASAQRWNVSAREKLSADGILREENGVLRMSQDYPFDSPSAAAAVLLGRNANGRLEWKDAAGCDLNQIESARLNVTDAAVDPNK